jgi:HSP20 family protein
MTFIRRNSNSELVPWNTAGFFVSPMRNEIEKVFDSFFRNDLTDDGQWGKFWSPDIDLIENDNAYVVKAELPGISKDDVKISITDNVLTIRGEKTEREDGTKKNFHRTERRYGAFQRSFSLPSFVDANRIEAEFKDGVLSINLPKSEQAKPKMIEVK